MLKGLRLFNIMQFFGESGRGDREEPGGRYGGGEERKRC